MNNLENMSDMSDDDDFEQMGGGYDLRRYYLNRLLKSKYDPDVINFKTDKVHVTKNGILNMSYSRTCGGPKKPDRQPIAVTQEELDRIDKITGGKGISYSEAKSIPGRDQNIKYICPKFWDIKHEIPLDPNNPVHPIEGGDNFDWMKNVVPPTITNAEMKDSEKYILERSGIPSSGKEEDSSWFEANKRDKDGKLDINKYKMDFIKKVSKTNLDYPLPCCGKGRSKNTSVKEEKKNDKVEHKFKKDTEVLILDPTIKNEGDITGKINKLLKNGDYEVYNDSVNEVKIYNESQLKQIKKSHTLKSDFPLLNGQLGIILNKDINGFFDQTDKLLNKTGFIRKGIEKRRSSNALLSSIHALFCKKVNYNQFIDNLKEDLKYINFKKHNLINHFKNDTLFDNKYNIIEFLKVYKDFVVNNYYIKSESIDNFVVKKLEKNIKDPNKLLEDIFNLNISRKDRLFRLYNEYSAINNFKDYLSSEECKDEKYIIPVINDITKFKESFLMKEISGIRDPIYIFILEYKQNRIYLNDIFTSMNIEELKNISNCGLIYKEGKDYEPLIYKKLQTYENFLQIRNRGFNWRNQVYFKTEENILKRGQINSNIKEGCKSCEVILYDVDGTIRTINDISPTSLIHYMNHIIDKIKYIYISQYKILKYNNDLSYEEAISKISNQETWKSKCQIIDDQNMVSYIELEHASNKIYLPIEKTYIYDTIKNNKSSYTSKNIKDISYYSHYSAKTKVSYIDVIDILNTFLNEKITRENTKLLVQQNILTHLIMDNHTYIPIKNEDFKKNAKYNFEIYENNHIFDNQYLLNNFSAEEYIITDIEYELHIEKMITSFIYSKIRSFEIDREIYKILNHPLMLNIHKRKKIFELLIENDLDKCIKISKTENKIISENITDYLKNDNFILYNSKRKINYYIKQYIEKLFTFYLQDYLSSNDENLCLGNNINEICYNFSDIHFKKYIFDFEYKSNFIRNIKNNDISHKIDDSKFIVSLTKGFPNKIYKLFGKNIKMIEPEMDDLNDLNVVKNSVESDCLHDLIEMIQNSDKDNYKLYENKYSNNAELIEHVKSNNYLIKIPDFIHLSHKKQILFGLITNIYSNDENAEYEFYILFDDDLIRTEKLENISICLFFQDKKLNSNNNSSLKQIIIHGRKQINFINLIKDNPYLKKQCIKNYPEIISGIKVFL